MLQRPDTTPSSDVPGCPFTPRKMNSPSTPGAGSSTASRTVGTRSPSVDPSLVQPGSSDLPTAPSDRPPTISAPTASPSSHVAPRQPFVPPQVPRSALPSTAGSSGRPIGGQVPPLNGPPRAPEPYDPLKPGVPIDEAKMISEGVRLRYACSSFETPRGRES